MLTCLCTYRRVVSKATIWSILLIGLVYPSFVSATTGPTYFLPPTKYQLDTQTIIQYSGTYHTTSISKAARLREVDIAIRPHSPRGLVGSGIFYGYDAQGFNSLWMALLYNFHLDKNKEMIFDLLGPTGSPLLGRITVTRQSSGDLVGRITLGNDTYNARWHRLHN